MPIQYLSYLLNENTPAYGGDPKQVRIEQVRSIDKGDTSNNSTFSFPAHIGTHIDFPYHFSAAGKRLQDYPADFWIFNKIGFLICSVDEIAINLDSLPADIDLLLVRTDFGLQRKESVYWQQQHVIRHELAGMLKRRFPQLRVFGFDMISLTSKLDRPEGKLAHQHFLLEHGILVLEDMKLSSLTQTPDKVIIAPLLIENADGAPCTVLAICN